MKQDIEAAKQAALKLLTSKRRSSGELERLMTLKGYDSEMVRETVLWAAQYQFINDAEYARCYVDENAVRCSKNQLRHALQERGVDEEFIEAALEEAQTDDRTVLRDLFKAAVKSDRSKKNVLKAARSLARKGFEYEDIQACMDEFAGFDPDERMTEFDL